MPTNNLSVVGSEDIFLNNNNQLKFAPTFMCISVCIETVIKEIMFSILFIIVMIALCLRHRGSVSDILHTNWFWRSSHQVRGLIGYSTSTESAAYRKIFLNSA